MSRVTTQAVNTTVVDKSTALRALREQEIRQYELVVLRDDYLIRYTSDTGGAVVQEAGIVNWKNTGGVRDFHLLYGRDGQIGVCTVEDWIINSDRVCNETQLLSLLQTSTVVAMAELQDLVPQELHDKIEFLPELTDLDLVDYALVDLRQRKLSSALRYSKLLIVLAVLAALIAGGYKLNKMMEPDISLPPEIVIKEVDKYEDYRLSVKAKKTASDVLDHLLLTIFDIEKLPEGWHFEKVIFTQNGFRVDLANRGGSVELIDRFGTEIGYGHLEANGLSVFYSSMIEEREHGWQDNIMSAAQVRNRFIDTLISMGVTVATKAPVAQANYQTQLIDIKWDSVSFAEIRMLSKLMEGAPFFINTIEVSRDASAQYRLNLVVEFVGGL